MSTIEPKHLLAISGHKGQSLEDAGWICDEDGDWMRPGVPAWDVLVYDDRYTLCHEVGVYGQRWEDVTDPDDLPRIARAMEAAHEAVRASLREANR